MESNSHDVIVIGGGPAGSTVATLTAREGRSVVLLDRERFPRFRVGESLMPATYWTLKRLGVLDRLKASHFPKKFSVQFFSSNGRCATPFYFSEIDPHENTQTWQVDRAEFDQILLQNSIDSGVAVHQQANVKQVLFDGPRAVGVDVEFAEGDRRRLHASVIVDASGQTAMLSRKLGLKQVDPKLQHAALYTRYRGAVRSPGKDEGATLIMHTREERSWFWYIPLPDDQVSVGVVGPMDYLVKQRVGTLQETFDEEVALCPALPQRIRDAERLTAVAAIRDFSYISRQIAGDGWVLAGDAFGFLDPIYSTGVFLALTSAENAADSINAAFAAGDFSGERLGRHGEKYVAGMEAMRKLVYAYYDPDFNFAEFLKRFPRCREDLVHLLIGNVFRRPAGELFDSMSEMCELPEPRTLAPLEPSS